MKVVSSGIVNGVIADKYGKRGTQFGPNGSPSCSIPLEILDSPAGTVSFAVFVEDRDAVPVCGFSWIHWLAADITRTKLEENESVTADDFVQGASSQYGAIGGLDALSASCYDGMCPPDAPHNYEIRVYALDCKLGLKKGFFLNQLFAAMEGHVLEEAVLKGRYDN